MNQKVGTLNTFMSRMEEEFDELSEGTLHPDTVFTDLEMWDSMHVLLLIAMIDAEYDVLLSGDDLQKVSSVQELYQLICSK